MAAEDGPDSSSEPNRGRFFSRKLRRASFISPATGERSNRTFTLRETSRRLWKRSQNGPPNESTPLLRRESLGQTATAISSRLGKILQSSRTMIGNGWTFASSPIGIDILKCSLAYLLGSMATFVPAIHNMIGSQQDSKHMVATVTVWFHPARSIGSMHEATILGVVALLYSWFISFTSMAISMAFADSDLIIVGHVVVLIVFLGGGLGAIAWVKQRLGHPLVNVACSLASLGCITVLIKGGAVQAGEFSTTRVFQVLLMVVMGVVATTLVNVSVFPTTARSRLAKDVVTNTDLLGEMLITITRAFLSGRKADVQDADYKRLVREHSASVSSMTKNLGESKREWYLLGRESLWKVEAKLVDCLIGLAQDLGGLRSAAFAQFAILDELVNSSQASDVRAVPASTRGMSPARVPLEIITESPEDFPLSQSFLSREESQSSQNQQDFSTGDSSQSSMPALKTPSDLFIAFLIQLGPSTKSLVYTLKQILDELPYTANDSHSLSWTSWFMGDPAVKLHINKNFHSSLEQAVDLYRNSRHEALAVLYQNRALNAALKGRADRKSSSFKSTTGSATATPGFEFVADIEEVSACCGHFSFALLDFAEDMLTYLSLLIELQQQLEHPLHSWRWMTSWIRKRTSNKPRTKLTRASTYFDHDEEHEIAQGIPSPIARADSFADPEKATRLRSWRKFFHKFGHILSRDDVKFSIKVGIGAVLFALPAFIPSTRPFFVLWRGEWGLVTYMAICCMTIGASNTTGINRIIGTCIGAVFALCAWITSSNHGDANPFLLAFWGWLVSLGCFYLILAKGNGPMGRFILLTYNLGALYSYSLSIKDGDNDDDEGGIDPAIWDIVMHRLVAVIVGCIWGVVITRVIWPVSARRKLQNGLTVLWLRMGLIWRRDPLAMFLLGEPRSKYMDIREESSLHGFLASLDGLRKAAQSEFELRGPFPDTQVKRMIECTGHMLDAFHAMNVVITKNLQCTPGEAAVLRFTRSERVQLSGRISHLFSVLASSVKLEYPVNDVLPSVEHTRDRLLARVAEFRQSGPGRELASEQDYELIYAYVLVTGQLWHEIQNVSTELCSLLGTLDEDNFKLE